MNVKLYKLLYLNTSVVPVLLAGYFSALDFYCFCRWHQLLSRPQISKGHVGGNPWSTRPPAVGYSKGKLKEYFFFVIQLFCLEQVKDEQGWEVKLTTVVESGKFCFRNSDGGWEGCCHQIGQFKRLRVVCDKWMKKTTEWKNRPVLKICDAWPVDARSLPHLSWA